MTVTGWLSGKATRYVVIIGGLIAFGGIGAALGYRFDNIVVNAGVCISIFVLALILGAMVRGGVEKAQAGPNAATCPRCNNYARHIAQYGRNYCDHCKQYV